MPETFTPHDTLDRTRIDLARYLDCQHAIAELKTCIFLTYRLGLQNKLQKRVIPFLDALL